MLAEAGTLDPSKPSGGFDFPDAILKQMREINRTVEKFPAIIPIPECCKLMHVSDEGLRRSVLQKQIPGSVWWQQLGKHNYVYRIQTLPFYFWQMKYLFPKAPLMQSGPSGSAILFLWPPSIQDRIGSLKQLVSAYPASIPVKACADFMKISDEGLRRAVRIGNVPGAVSWQRPGKDNRGYNIQTVPFFSWQTNDLVASHTESGKTEAA